MHTTHHYNWAVKVGDDDLIFPSLFDHLLHSQSNNHFMKLIKRHYFFNLQVQMQFEMDLRVQTIQGSSTWIASFPAGKRCDALSFLSHCFCQTSSALPSISSNHEIDAACCPLKRENIPLFQTLFPLDLLKPHIYPQVIAMDKFISTGHIWYYNSLNISQQSQKDSTKVIYSPRR